MTEAQGFYQLPSPVYLGIVFKYAVVLKRTLSSVLHVQKVITLKLK